MTILINTLKSSQRILRAKHSGLRKEIDLKTNCYQILNLVTNQRLEIITTLLQNPVSRWGFPLMSVMSIIVGHSQQRHFFFFLEIEIMQIQKRISCKIRDKDRKRFFFVTVKPHIGK